MSAAWVHIIGWIVRVPVRVPFFTTSFYYSDFSSSEGNFQADFYLSVFTH